jgi:hypothetical protein
VTRILFFLFCFSQLQNRIKNRQLLGGTARQLVYEFYDLPDCSMRNGRSKKRLLEDAYPELKVNRQQPESSFSVNRSSVMRNDGCETTLLRCRPSDSKSSNIWVSGNACVKQGEIVAVVRSNAAGEEGFALIRTHEGVEGFIRAEYVAAGRRCSHADSADSAVLTKRLRVHDQSTNENSSIGQVAHASDRRKLNQFVPAPTLPLSGDVLAPSESEPPSQHQLLAVQRKKNGQIFCKHNRYQYFCKQCPGRGICSHNNNRYTCKQCRGGGIVAATGHSSAQKGAVDVHALSQKLGVEAVHVCAVSVSLHSRATTPLPRLTLASAHQ